MFYKTNLAYLAEDHQLDYDDFCDYCFANFPNAVWEVFDGIRYCYKEEELFLVVEYKQYKQNTSCFFATIEKSA